MTDTNATERAPDDGVMGMENKSSWIARHPKPPRLWVQPETSWNGYASIGDYPEGEGHTEYEFVDADLAQTIAANAALLKRLEEARGVISRVNDKALMNAGEFVRYVREETRAFLAGGE